MKQFIKFVRVMLFIDALLFLSCMSYFLCDLAFNGKPSYGVFLFYAASVITQFFIILTVYFGMKMEGEND
jgi:hypothetical protein